LPHRSLRLHKELAVHRGLMLHALEAEETLLVKSKNVRGLLQRRQIDVHQDAELGTQQGKVVVVIRLKIPERDESRLIAMNRNKRRSEPVHLTKLSDGFLRTGLFDCHRLSENDDLGRRFALIVMVTIFEAA
jgi:hypothetical protein